MVRINLRPVLPAVMIYIFGYRLMNIINRNNSKEKKNCIQFKIKIWFLFTIIYCFIYLYLLFYYVYHYGFNKLRALPNRQW